MTKIFGQDDDIVDDIAAVQTEVDNLEKVQELTKQILVRLEELYENMDTITVLPPEKVKYWKEMLRNTELYIRKQSSRWIGLNLIEEAE